jgi:iron-sulfur cluster assembly accessory protein
MHHQGIAALFSALEIIKMLPQITLTPAAEKFIRRIVRFSGLPSGAGFRLTVRPGGCSGYSSEFSAQAQAHEDERSVTAGGLLLFLDAQSCQLLDGASIDFTETATQSGLSFIHPDQASCGCSSAEAPTRPAVATVALSAVGGRRRGPVVLAS